jgi:hypothetical protein
MTSAEPETLPFCGEIKVSALIQSLAAEPSRPSLGPTAGGDCSHTAVSYMVAARAYNSPGIESAPSEEAA